MAKNFGWIKIIGDALDYDGDILYAEHHESHAASAFYPSPFDEALVLTLDGVGEWATSSISIGKKNKLDLVAELDLSLGLLYSAFTYYTGFKVNSGEYKVMGLARTESRFIKTEFWKTFWIYGTTVRLNLIWHTSLSIAVSP